MENSRLQRRATQRSRQRRVTLALAIVAAVAAVIVVAALAFGAWQAFGPKPSSKPQPSATNVAPATSTASLPTSAIEVPDLAGLSPEEAELVVKAAGLVLAIRVEGAPVEDATRAKVRNQTPEAGSSAKAGDTVTVVVPPVSLPETTAPAAPAPETSSGSGFVVVIDPGHQGQGDSTPEPIGPGASETKPSVTSGATGVATGRPEHVVVLEISKKLEARLKAQGVKVIMTRTKADVSLSNSERAKIANDADADLFIRIHADSIDSSSREGISTLVPGANRWTGPIRNQSAKAGRDVQRAVVRATGAADRGVVERTDMSGFNWSKVPSIIVESGFMSNPDEDRKLSTGSYQDKLAEGMARGVLAYLNSSR